MYQSGIAPFFLQVPTYDLGILFGAGQIGNLRAKHF
jgi:hypothetical protein